MTPVNIEAIPEELRARPQWVCWKFEVRDGKATKVPVNPNTGGLARTDRPTTWGTLAEALECLKRRPQLDGLGFVFARDDPYVGIDLDNCIAEDRTLKPWALPLFSDIGGYVEVTPSGRGLHLIVQGALPEDSRHKVPHGDGHVEAYDWGRFFTMTGQPWGVPVTEIPGRLEQIEALVETILKRKEPERTEPSQPAQPVNLDDRSLLDRMFASKAGHKIRALWNGDMSGVPRKASGEPDHSSADMALLNHLAWWTDRDDARMDRLFRQSALYRAKWERDDYRAMSIGEAIRRTANGFRPGVREEPPPLPGDEDAPPPPEEPPVWIAVREVEARERLEARVEAIKNGVHPKITFPQTATAAELLERTFDPVQWIVPEIIPEGLALLFGRTKMRKSWLALAIALAVSQGGRVLGDIEVEQREVLYLAMEDTERRLQDRLRTLLQGEPAPAGFHYRTQYPRFGHPQRGELCLRAWHEIHPKVGVIFFDTYAKLCPGARAQGSAYNQDYENAAMFKNLADDLGISAIALHHQSRAMRDDWVDTINASTGLAAACDTLILLDGVRDEPSCTLRFTGRDVEAADLHLDWDRQTMNWISRGPAEEMAKTRQRQDVYDALRILGRPANSKDIASQLGKSQPSVKKLLQRMEHDNEIIVLFGGTYTLPENQQKRPN